MSDALALAKRHHAKGEFPEAAAHYLAHFTQHPDDAESAFLLAQLYSHLGNPTMARDLIGATLPLFPRNGLLRALMGWFVMAEGKHHEAEDWLVQAAILEPTSSLVWCYLAMAASARGRWDQTHALFRHALAVNADDVVARYNYALALLRRGIWRKGWTWYEHRWDTPGFAAQHRRHSPGTLWKGEPIRGKTLLVQHEQGQGDLLMFARYLPILARETGARVFLEVGRPELGPLLERHRAALGVEMLVSVGDLLPDCDHHVPIMSLPHRLRRWAPLWEGPYLGRKAS